MTVGVSERASPRRDGDAESSGVLARRALILGVALVIALPAGLAANTNRLEAALVVLLVAAASWLATGLVSRESV